MPKKTKNRTAKKSNPRKIGKSIEIQGMLTTYVMPPLHELERKSSTTSSLVREARRFAEWQAATSGKTPIADIDRQTLTDYRIYLGEQGKSASLRNNAVRAVMQILNAAYKHGFIKHAPKLEALPHDNVAPKVYPSDEEIDVVFDYCRIARWPKKDSKKRPLHYPPSTAMRVAIALYRTFGFRTQELIQLEKNYRALSWGNISAPGLTPNPVGRCVWDQGFLHYVPQKQERRKPHPLYVPIPPCIRAALNMVSQGPMRPKDPVLDFSRSALTFREQFYEIFERAGVKPREESNVPRYTPKHLRKAASTVIDTHRSGMAEHIVGHSSDRTGQSEISKKHYINAEMAVLECIQTMPLPKSFEWFEKQ